MSVLLQASDSEIAISVPLKIANMSGTLKTMLEDIGDACIGQTIKLPDVNSFALKKIIEYGEHYIDGDFAEYIVGPKYRETKLSEWDNNFMQLTNEEIFTIMLAVNILNFPQLLNVTCMAIALKIRHKSPEEIRKEFNIENDWLPGELEKFEAENPWCVYKKPMIDDTNNNNNNNNI
jgi:S-phase kinase-associated protein 1